MRNGTKRTIAGVAAAAVIMGGFAVTTATAVAAADAAPSSASASTVIEFKGAAVVSVSVDEIVIKTVASGAVTVKIGKDTVIKGNLAVDAKVDVKCVKVSGSFVATLVVVVG